MNTLWPPHRPTVTIITTLIHIKIWIFTIMTALIHTYFKKFTIMSKNLHNYFTKTSNFLHNLHNYFTIKFWGKILNLNFPKQFEILKFPKVFRFQKVQHVLKTQNSVHKIMNIKSWTFNLINLHNFFTQNHVKHDMIDNVERKWVIWKKKNHILK